MHSHAKDMVWSAGHTATAAAATTASTNSTGQSPLNNTDSDTDEDSDGDDDNFEFVVSKEFLDFIAISAAHRKERDKKKKQRQLQAKTVHMDERLSHLPQPSEAPDVAHTHELGALYGAAAKDIEALEARVNLFHDAAVDSLAPTMWPSIPIMSEGS